MCPRLGAVVTELLSTWVYDARHPSFVAGGTDEHQQVVSRLLGPLDFVATVPKAARAAGAARLERHRSDGKLGLGNALIAAVAQGIDATIVTRNRPDFERQGATVLSY